MQLDDELEYDEPEPLPFPARHWLGAALVEAGRFGEAEQVYRADLDEHPHNGWSLLGLKLALKGQGKTRRHGGQGPREELGARRPLGSRFALLEVLGS